MENSAKPKNTSGDQKSKVPTHFLNIFCGQYNVLPIFCSIHKQIKPGTLMAGGPFSCPIFSTSFINNYGAAIQTFQVHYSLVV